MPEKDYTAVNAALLERTNAESGRGMGAAPPDPTCEVRPARSGEPTLRVGDTQMHSAYDPLREAESIAAAALEGAAANAVGVVCGLGLGYLAEALRKRLERVVVVEPTLAIVRTACAARDLSALTDVEVIAGASPLEAADRVERACGGDLKRALLVKHPPSLALHPAWFDEFTAAVRSRRNAKVKGLRILVNTPLYGGSLPVARYCAAALQRLGHQVETLDNEIYDPARRRIGEVSSSRVRQGRLNGMLTAVMADSVAALAQERAVDLVWCVAQSPLTPEALAELRRARIPVVFWFVEDWRLFAYWRDWAPLYDYFLTIQKEPFLGALRRLGVKRAAYLPLAADPEVHRPLELDASEAAEFGADLSHVGAGYRNRRHTFTGLTDLDFKLWGNDWDDAGSLRGVLQREGARLTTAETVKVFNATKVNLNLHSSSFHDGVDPDGDFVNPRTFEIAACGGFQLVDHRALLPELFAPDEMAVFRHEGELRGLMEHFLANPGERSRFAGKGRERVLAEHTYEHRMQRALEFIYSCEDAPASRRHPDHVDNLATVAAGDPELAALLERFRDRGVVTLEDLATEINAREGDLTQAEAIILLMLELRRWAREKDLVY